MIKKYSLYTLIALLGTASIDTGAIRQSQIPAVRNHVINFVENQMRQLFTPIQRVFTLGYVVSRTGNNVFVRRVGSLMSANPGQARTRFNSAIARVVQQILDIYDENGQRADQIDVSTTSYPNTFYFTPHFYVSSDEEVEDSVDESDDEGANNNPADEFTAPSPVGSSSSVNSFSGDYTIQFAR